LLDTPVGKSDGSGAEMIFTSGRPHRLSRTLIPFFGGRVPA
jgi:glutamate racemase